jgi:hypothetical protein
MLRPALPALVVAVALAAGMVGSPSAQTPADSTFERIYLAYTAGDVGVVRRTIQREETLIAVRGDLFNAIGRWKRSWQRRQVMFLIEVAILGLQNTWAPPGEVLKSAREMLISRPAKPGQDATEDAFEVLYHQAAITLLVGANLPDEADRYLDALDRRVAPAEVPGAAMLVGPRLPLERALARDVRSAPRNTPIRDRTGVLEAAEGEYVRAALHPSTRREALVRRAFVLHRLGRFKDALASLDRLPPDPDDRVLDFWARMIRGKVLDALGQSDAAMAAFQSANAQYPRAQTPMIAMSSLLLRLGRPVDAQTWAATARRQLIDGIDPWWEYWNGDVRFLDAWLEQLRRAAAQ